MLLHVGALALGLVALVWSADKFILGASVGARLLGVSPLVVGILIVGIGTSAPEMLVSGIAAFDGQPGLALGNAIGSNITNIALIIGFTALLIPLKVQSNIIRRELPLMMLVMVAGWVLLLDGELGVLDGALLVIGFVLVVLRQAFEARAGYADVLAAEFDESIIESMTLPKSVVTLLIGLVVLIGSAKVLVWGAVGVAQALGVSDLIIGLTIVAIGTSLPELAASMSAARKAEYDIAIGNVIGSNMFNLLGVMAIPGLVSPGPVDPAVLSRDYPLMVALGILFCVVASGRNGKGRINRAEGALLLLVYIGYLSWLVYSTTR